MPESVYRQRNTQNSPYYQCVEDHFETFEQVYDERFERQYGFFRPYVKQVIYRYLDCGVLKNGFAGFDVRTVATSIYWLFHANAATFARLAIRSGWWNLAIGCVGKL